MDRGAWKATSPWGCKEADTTEWLTHTHHLHEVPRSVRFTKIESRMGGPGGRGGDEECFPANSRCSQLCIWLHFNGDSLSWEDEKVLEPYGGDGCLALRMCITPVNCTLKMVTMVNVKLKLLNAILPQF